MAAPEAVEKRDNIQSHSTSHPCSFAQKGAVAALKATSSRCRHARRVQHAPQLHVHRITKIPNITAVRPEGAFYILVNISQLGLSCKTSADRLLSKANVAVSPRDRLWR